MIELCCDCGLPVEAHPEVEDVRTTFGAENTDEGHLTFHLLCDGRVESVVPT